AEACAASRSGGAVHRVPHQRAGPALPRRGQQRMAGGRKREDRQSGARGARRLQARSLADRPDRQGAAGGREDRRPGRLALIPTGGPTGIRPVPAMTGPRADAGTRAAQSPWAATTTISTRYFGVASLASTVARVGSLSCTTQASQTAFMAAKSFMSAR